MPKTIHCAMCGFRGQVPSNRKSCPRCGAHGHCAPSIVPEKDK